MLPKTLDTAQQFPRVSEASWRALVEIDLQGAPFERRLVTHTYEGIDIKPLYTRDDAVPGGDPSGHSGLMPMTRGARLLGVSRHGWDIRQEVADADPLAANRACLDELEGGATSLVLRLDACARAQLDPADPVGRNLAARDGIAAYTVDDLDRVLQGVHLEMITVSLEAGAAFTPASAMLAALWERRGVSFEVARGCLQADPLAVLARDGHLPYSLDEGMSRLGELARWSVQRLPLVRAVRVGTAPYHHAGATATQDLAFSMGTALEYLRAMTRAGLTVDQAAGQVLFSFATGCGLFLAIAKLRAARRLWARVVEACGGSDPARAMTMYVRPSKRVLTTRDPWVNILRTTTCAVAAGLAGADAIGVTPFDAAIGDPSPLARRVARNTHHVLLDECHLHRVCDVPGGSWYIEHLTDQVAAKAWALLQEIESRGGMARALADGWVARQIDGAMLPRIHNLATRKDVVVGVSEFPLANETRPAVTPSDRDAIVGAARARLAGRAPAPRTPASGDRSDRCADALQAARANASVREIADLLRPADDKPAAIHTPVHVHPFAEAFERLRDACDRYAQQCGGRPRVFLVAVGTAPRHLARLTYARHLFQAGGFDVRESVPDVSPDAAGVEFVESGAHIAVLCGPDDAYQNAIPRFAPVLRGAGARRIVLAGNPGGHEAAYRDAGIDRFIFVKCDVVEVLTSLLAEEGVYA
ncbi:MAG: methylmalonyl-CoA mutase family protein [Planctomycetota bacterium]|nr:methylmalonyl-CoA mutase family protein [Planctomycetota bacterium]